MSADIEALKSFVSDMIDAIIVLSYVCYRHDLYQNYEATFLDLKRVKNILAKYDITLEYLTDIDEIIKDLEKGTTPYNRVFNLIKKLKNLVIDRIEKMSL
ncbi:MAG: hypothetical protein GXO26_00965 [Crenarchaeota archaeon]|nr:hypothetical protein [Thermoproteota archaeon]